MFDKTDRVFRAVASGGPGEQVTNVLVTVWATGQQDEIEPSVIVTSAP